VHLERFPPNISTASLAFTGFSACGGISGCPSENLSPDCPYRVCSVHYSDFVYGQVSPTAVSENPDWQAIQSDLDVDLLRH
jgi:hypothetical protein